jgi:tetratricopeptide (TPR) repeat protein
LRRWGGGRESGTERLQEAVEAYRAALEEFTRERAPLDWATTQNNLGNALRTLGERESGTGRLEEALSAYRAALEERTRERVPLDWARTQNNLGTALWRLGERTGNVGLVIQARQSVEAAYRLVTEAGYDQYREEFETRLREIDASIAELRKGGRSGGTE